VETIHRFGLATAAIAAALTVILSMAIVGYVTSQSGAVQTAAPQDPGGPSTAGSSADPTGGPQTIYLRFPQETQKAVHAGPYRPVPTKPPPTATPPQTPAPTQPRPTRTPRPTRSFGPGPSGGDN
jgi:hypothetical protein